MTTQDAVLAGAVPTAPNLRVLRADNGFEAPLHALTRSREEQPLLWSIDDRMRLFKRRMTGGIVMRHQEGVSNLRLASGKQLVVASSHRVRKLQGWTPVGELLPRDRIAVVRRIGEPTEVARTHDAEVIMLAHMISDGSCIKRQPVRYASIDEANLAAVTMAAAHFGVRPIRDEYAAARVTTLRLPAPYTLTHGKRNPIAEWLDSLGLSGLRSHEKFLPTQVFATPNDQVALFLRHLWATDGSVRWDAKTSQARVYYASTSRRLTDDVLQLLLRVGVTSRITQGGKGGLSSLLAPDDRPC